MLVEGTLMVEEVPPCWKRCPHEVGAPILVEEVPPPPMLEEVQREEKLSPAPTSGPSTSDQATQPRSTIAIDHQHRQRR